MIFDASPEHVELLHAKTRTSEVEEQKRYEDLIANGFVTVWDKAIIAMVRELNVAHATVRADGARWPLARCVFRDGLAMMIQAGDFDLLTLLHSTQRSTDVSDKQLASLLRALAGRRFDKATLDSAETVLRLGGVAALVDYLQNL